MNDNAFEEERKKDEITAAGAIALIVVPLISTLMIMFAWNVGIEPFFKTLGDISFWQALGLDVAFALLLVHRFVGAK